MIVPFTAVRTRGLPIAFFLEDATINSIEIQEDGKAVLFHFESGFYMNDRDGNNPKPLIGAVMTVRMEEGFDAMDNTAIVRKLHTTHKLKFKWFKKNVAKRKMKVYDILFSHHTRSIVVEGAAKGVFAVQVDHVKDIKLDYYEPHTKVYDSEIVNRRDVFRLKKPV